MPVYFNIQYELSPARVWERIDRRLPYEGADYICVADGNVLQMVHRDPSYRSVVRGGMFSICDSNWVPLFLFGLYGMRVQQYCGSQIFEDALRRKKYRMLFMGTSDAVLKPLQERLAERFDPAVADMQFYALPFCDVEDFDYEAIANMVNADRPDIIWVSLGAPKQEIFMNRLKPYLSHGVIIAVGAVFKFFSGTTEKRAPAWMVRCHAEFVYRLFSNPRKQFPRCWKIVTALPSVLLGEWKRKRRSLKSRRSPEADSAYLDYLIRLALGTESSLPPTEEVSWQRVYALSKEQGVAALSTVGLERLYQMTDGALSLYSSENKVFRRTWLSSRFTTEKLNKLLDERSVEVTRLFAEAGYRSCILKGQGAALLYPDPMLRTPGDIDLWINADSRELVDFLRTRWTVGHPGVLHAEVDIYPDTEVEVHYLPAWLYNPFAHRRLKRFFNEEAERQFGNISTAGFACPTDRFNLVFMAIHLYKHIFDENVLLKQLVDYIYVLRHASSEDRQFARDFLRELKMSSFTAYLMWCLKTRLGLSDEFLLCAPSSACHRPFWESFWLYPWKLWQWCWRKKNGYI